MSAMHDSPSENSWLIGGIEMVKRKKKGNLAPCPRCGELRVLNKHHYLPQRFYGKNPFYIRICDECHEEVEKLIPEERKLSAVEYFEIAYCFVYKQTHLMEVRR
jgi:ribosomal protein S27AE